MPIERIEIGVAPNDGAGDPLRVAFEKTNRNFESLASSIMAQVNQPARHAGLHHEHAEYVPRFLAPREPSEAPPAFGAMWIDTVSGRIYVATGTSQASDWRELQFAAAR
jgi:hypothetical protein